MRKKVLLTGGSGLLGLGLAESCPNQWEVSAVRMRKTSYPEYWAKTHVLDIQNKKCVEEAFSKDSFDVVIHAAGIASVDYVNKNYAESLESNIVGTLNVSSACRKRSIPLVYISSNAVFDGQNAPYAEHHKPNPVNEYGELKLECERLIQKTLKRYLIVRPILMYGWNSRSGRANPVTWLLQKLDQGETVKVVDDVRENPLYNFEAGRSIWVAVEQKLEGILHLAGGTEVSRYELALATAKIFGKDQNLIEAVKSSYFPELAKRPPNTTFSTEKMEKVLGIKPLSLYQGLEAMKNSPRAP